MSSSFESSVIDVLKLPTFPVEKNASGDDILAAVLSTKYRRVALAKKSQEKMKAYIDTAIRMQQPLKFYMMCGGYKQARLASSPFIDWAEAFNVSYIMRLAVRLASMHEPGIEVIYRHHTILLGKINNYLDSDFTIYKSQFDELLTFYQRQVPNQLNVRLRLEESHQPEAYNALAEDIQQRAKLFENTFWQLDAVTQTSLVEKSWRNIKWQGREDWRHLTSSEKHEKARQALFLDQAFLASDEITSLPAHSDKLTAYFRPSSDGARLQYGGCSSSSVQFWAGAGVFMPYKDRYIPWILSPTQLESVRLEQYKPLNIEVPESLCTKIYLGKVL